MPRGVAIDADGKPTRDAAAALDGGAQLPAGGIKGALLALLVEVLSGGLAGGDLAVAMPNWGNASAKMTFCLDTLGWVHGNTARARNVWAKKDLGAFSKNFSATVAAVGHADAVIFVGGLQANLEEEGKETPVLRHFYIK